jgi:hypothetical protein
MSGGHTASSAATIAGTNEKASLILLDRELEFTAAQSLERMRTDKVVEALMQKIEIVQDASQEAPVGQPRTESARGYYRGKERPSS